MSETVELRDRLVEAFKDMDEGPDYLADIALEALNKDPIWAILLMVYNERVRQEAQYGHINDDIQDGTGPDAKWLLPYDSSGAKEIQEWLRKDYDSYEDENGLPTWMHLVREEIAEAFELESRDPNFVTEIIQVAALCASWAQRRIR